MREALVGQPDRRTLIVVDDAHPHRLPRSRRISQAMSLSGTTLARREPKCQGFARPKDAEGKFQVPLVWKLLCPATLHIWVPTPGCQLLFALRAMRSTLCALLSAPQSTSRPFDQSTSLLPAVKRSQRSQRRPAVRFPASPRLRFSSPAPPPLCSPAPQLKRLPAVIIRSQRSQRRITHYCTGRPSCYRPTVVTRATFRPYCFANLSDSFLERGRGGCPSRSCCSSRRTR